jgi:hypothetical protein
MGDVCVWIALDGSCICSRSNVHVGPVRAIDMRRRKDGTWVLCSGGEDWRVCVTFFAAPSSASAARACGSEPAGSSFIIDSRVRSIHINPWSTEDASLCIVGSQTGRLFSISLTCPPSLLCSLPLDSPDIDCLASSPEYVFCCGRNGAIVRVSSSALTSHASSLPVMQQLSHAPALPPVTSLCIDSTRMSVICLHGPSTISEHTVSSDPSHFRIINSRIITSAIWAPPCNISSASPSPLSPSVPLSSTSCLAADAGFVAVFGCRGDAALVRDGHSMPLTAQHVDPDRFYLCCCRLQHSSVLSGCAIRSNGTLFGFRVADAGCGAISTANFGVQNRLGRCSAIACTAVGSKGVFGSDLVICAGSISGTLVLYCGPAACDDAGTKVASSSDSKNAVLIMKKLHGVKPVSCIQLKLDADSGHSGSGTLSMRLYSAGHDGCIVTTHLHIAHGGSSHIVAQQRVRNFHSAPIIAFNLSCRLSSCSTDSHLSFTSIHNGRVLYSSGSHSMPAPPTAVGAVDQHRFSTLAAACMPSAVILADVCKGQVRVMAAGARVGCHRVIPGIHTDTINDIAFVCNENASRNAADTSDIGIICTVSTDGCCCICSIPTSCTSTADNLHVLSRLYADASQAAGSALLCVKVVWLGDSRALIVAGGAFSCVLVWLLHFHAPDSGGCALVDVISHACHICNSCEDEGKCVSAIHCQAPDSDSSASSVNSSNCCISACLNDGRVLFLSCSVGSQGSISILPALRSSLRFSHAVLCVAADCHGKLFFGLSNGCLHFADASSPQLPALGDSKLFTSTPLPPFKSSAGSGFSPSQLPSPSTHFALHVAGLNALLPLHLGMIMCGGEDGCVSLVSLDTDGQFIVHESRRVSDGAIKKLLLLRSKTLILERVIDFDVCVICHNQRSLAVSVQLHDTVSAPPNDTGAANGSLGGSCSVRITSMSPDLILDVGKSWTACVVGAAECVGDDSSVQKRSAPVAIGGWGVQMIRM